MAATARFRLSAVVGDTFRAVAGVFWLMLALAVIDTAVSGMLVKLLWGWPHSSMDMSMRTWRALYSHGITEPAVVVEAVLRILANLVNALVIGTLAYSAVKHLQGRPASIHNAVAAMRQALIPLLVLALLATAFFQASHVIDRAVVSPNVLIALGHWFITAVWSVTVAVLILTLLFSFVWSMAVAVAAMERLGVMALLRRIVSLTRGRRVGVLAAGVAFIVPLFALNAVRIWLVMPLFAGHAQYQAYALTGRLLISVVGTMFAAAGMAALYRELRRCEDARSPPVEMPQA